jgi:hypothetical protein
VFRPNPHDLTREVSSNARVFIGILCLLFSCSIFFMTYVGDDEALFILSIVVAFPLLLVSLSLLFGKASKGKGLFSSYSLYFISIVILLSSTIAFLNGSNASGIVFVIGLGCFYLAKKRGKSNKKLRP